MNLVHTCHRLFFPHHTNNHRATYWHPHGLAWLSIITLAFTFIVRTGAHVTPQVLGYSSVITAEHLLDLTNQERRKYGLIELELNTQLGQAASAKGQDMLAKNYWAHVSPSGEQPWAFFTRAGYAYLYAGENLARDFTDANSVVAAWMASPTHRDNILNPHYQDIGFAIIDGKLNGVETTLIVQEFGKPRSASAITQSGSASSSIAQLENPPLIDTTHDDRDLSVTNLPNQVETTEPNTLVNNESTTLGETHESPSSPSLFSPHALTRSWAIALSIILATVLVIDILVIRHHRIPRLTGRPLAHLIFVIGVLISIISSQPGLIR